MQTVLTLYQTPGACSLAVLIALHIADLPHSTVDVDLRGHTLPDGSNYYAINRKGSVPALANEAGEVMTEAAVLLQYVSDRAPSAGLIPADGIARYRQLEMLNFLATELHKSFPPPALYAPGFPIEARVISLAKLTARLEFLSQELSRDYLFGDAITAADTYLFTLLLSTDMHDEVDLRNWPSLNSYRERLSHHPAVVAAMREEGRTAI